MIKTMERFVGDVAVSLRRPEGMNECPELGNGKAGPNVWKWVNGCRMKILAFP